MVIIYLIIISTKINEIIFVIVSGQFALSILYLINYYNGNSIFIGLFQIILIIPTLSILVRRLHDVNKSGWLILFSFFPLFNLYLLYLLVQPSSNDSKYNNR